MYALDVDELRQNVAVEQFSLINSHCGENIRNKAQDGVMLKNMTEYKSLDRYLDEQDDISNVVLKKYIITKAAACEIREVLGIIGIDNHYIFRDVEALARDVFRRFFNYDR